MVPNFFASEYSYLPEENFLRWFLKWAIESNRSIKPNLYAVAKSFLALVCSRNNFQMDLKIDTVADVTYVLNSEYSLWFILNDNIALAINDGNLYEHALDEIQKNLSKISGDYNISSSRVCTFSYDCRDGIDDIRSLADQGFPLIDRRDLLDLFSSPVGVRAEVESDTYSDFKKYLLQLESEAQGFLRMPPAEWKWAQWVGYCHDLYLRFGNGRRGRFVDLIARTSHEFFDMGHQVVDGGIFFLRIDDKHQLSFMLQIEKLEERRKWHAYWQDKVFATSQQLGLEIVRPHCVGAETDVALATLGQSYVFLQSDGLVDVQATYDKIDLVSFRVTT
jgi:hypothetical protein